MSRSKSEMALMARVRRAERGGLPSLPAPDFLSFP
ncbi:MAG: hypothetical protein JWN48_374 [Myxococcaceae bacterium]|nr:hypothetical protein [Myxococcaceae bacterium]